MSTKIEDGVVVELSAVSVAVNERTYMEKRDEIINKPNLRVIYVTREGGKKPIQRRAIPGGKWMTMEVNAIPGLVEHKPEQKGGVVNKQAEDDLKPNYNILPAGKIPGIMLHQIVEFFKAVMVGKFKAEAKGATTHGKYEAMAHIIWNPKTGYRVSIPTQKVTGGSVNYEHDSYNLADGDVVVVDIHSHNTMSAFYSGTDDNDDKHALIYTGVIGTLDKEPTMKFRLNNLQYKVELPPDFIFDFSMPKVDVPQDWLDKVQMQTYSYGNFGFNQGGRQQNRGGKPEFQVFGGRNQGGNNSGKNLPARRDANNPGNINPRDLFDSIENGDDEEGLRDFHEMFQNAINLEDIIYGDPFDPETVHQPGVEFTAIVKTYCGLDHVVTDQYPALRTLEDYEHILELADDDQNIMPAFNEAAKGTIEAKIFSWPNLNRAVNKIDADTLYQSLAVLSRIEDFRDCDGILMNVIPQGRREWYNNLDEKARYSYLENIWSLMQDKLNGDIY